MILFVVVVGAMIVGYILGLIAALVHFNDELDDMSRRIDEISEPGDVDIWLNKDL